VVNIFFEDTEALDLDPDFFVLWLSKVCKVHNRILGEINVVFCSDEYLLEMNREHLNHDFYTDIITFDFYEDKIVGDLFISVDRVRENAANLKVEFQNELNRVVVHGTLHLLGYKDKSKTEEEKMRSLEDEALLIVPRGTCD